ncbi:sensor histidine kinase [uncultured Flavobacterium sp.]|uniref:sensor histidine kinase n=1 Tax=uncultured Flavobacterium sp. TaxID=165435 RepID=UPI002597C683|nr:sensor histidine kinase [uncultured Flavobacterium sp.]
MSLLKKFLVLTALPFVIILSVYIFSKNATNEVKDVFVTIFSLGFFVIISFNSVYVSDFFKKQNYKLFSKLFLSCLTTLVSISIFSFALNIILRDSNFRLATIFSQAILGICIFLLEYLVLYVLEKKDSSILKFEDRKHHYFWLVLSVILIEFALYLLIIYRDINDLYEFILLNKFLIIYMILVPVFSFLFIRLFIYFKFNTISNILLSSFCSVVISFFSVVILVLKEFKFNENPGVYLIIYLIGLFSSLSIYAFLYYRNQMSEKKLLKLQNIQKDAQYLELKSQINPHFLFNNLNTLISFIEINPTKAIDFGHNLANVYRHYLKKQEEDFVSLKDELLFIKEYLEIYKAKFENGFNFSISDEFRENQYVLSSAIQELIDNIFKHNNLDEDNPIEIKIYTKNDYLVIYNSVNSKNRTDSTNFGLVNINKRYEILTNSSIVIINDKNSFSVQLTILNLE